MYTIVIVGYTLKLKLCSNYKQQLLDNLEDDDPDTCTPQIIVKRLSPGICRLCIETYFGGECKIIYDTLITDDQAIDLCKVMESYNIELFDQ